MGCFAARFAGEVAQADDPDQPLVGIKDGQAADLLFAHPLRN